MYMGNNLCILETEYFEESKFEVQPATFDKFYNSDDAATSQEITKTYKTKSLFLAVCNSAENNL